MLTKLKFTWFRTPESVFKKIKNAHIFFLLIPIVLMCSFTVVFLLEKIKSCPEFCIHDWECGCNLPVLESQHSSNKMR